MAALTPQAGKLLLLAAVVLCSMSCTFGFAGVSQAATVKGEHSMANYEDIPDYEDLPPLTSPQLDKKISKAKKKRKSKKTKHKIKKQISSFEESLRESSGGNKKHHISIYIEPLCPGSRKLMKIVKKIITKHPDKIGNLYINVRGFVKEYPLPGGYYKFSCQNGCAECIANLILNCASYYSTSHVQYINFALCVMASSYPPLEAENCAPKAGLSYDQIDSCSRSRLGGELLHQAGLKQELLKPRMTAVPWIVFNGVHIDQLPSCL